MICRVFFFRRGMQHKENLLQRGLEPRTLPVRSSPAETSTLRVFVLILAERPEAR